jgi:hypothetical protein
MDDVCMLAQTANESESHIPGNAGGAAPPLSQSIRLHASSLFGRDAL